MVVLKFKVKLRKGQKSDQKIIDDIKSIFKKFQKQYKHNFLITCEDVIPVVQDLIYEEDFHEVLVCLSNEGLQDEASLQDIFENLLSFWCYRQKKHQKNNTNLQWLIPISEIHFYDKKPTHLDVETHELAFGTFPDITTFMCHYRYECRMEEAVCSFSHTKKLFNLFLNLDHHESCNFNQMSQKFVVQYNSINRVVVCDTELYFHLSSVPFVYTEYQVNEEIHFLDLDQDDFVGGESKSVSVSSQDSQQKRWERVLSFGCQCNKSLCNISKIGRSMVFKVALSSKFKAKSILERLKHRCDKNTEFCYSYVKVAFPGQVPILKDENFPFNNCSPSASMELKHMLFDCCYAWESIFSRSLEVQDQVDLHQQSQCMGYNIDHWSFLKRELSRFAEANPSALAEALYHISDMMNRNLTITFCTALKPLFEHYCEMPKDSELPKGMCLIRRVIITPSKMIFLPPAECFENRVIRDWPYADEYLLRVSFTDDNLQKLTFAVQYNSQKDFITRVIVGDRLLGGIQIGERHYEFLASSNSQLREHGVWMYARDCNYKTASDIRRWMGDFSQIRNVAKHMARMGQCFSTSDEAVQITLNPNNEMQIPEINTLDKKYTISDGIGKISPDLANEIHVAKMRSMKIEPDMNIPTYKSSAFQIRYKGCKGMVAIDVGMRGRILAFRPSMNKFRCESANKLEIVKFSAPRPLYLNRPLITILEQLGVSPTIFLNLQKNMVLNLTDSLIYEKKAAELLSRCLHVDIAFEKLEQSGIHLTEEPFFRSLLITVYKSSIDKLRTKARILIPPKYGRNMLGVLDESRSLKYGEVFVQYSEEIGSGLSKTKILEGTVVVTKNPCMHPGDVRKLQAVDIPHLHHIKDCVVFPADNQYRPHADEMAGSDLDGDEFVIIWLPELIFPANNSHPMDYPVCQEVQKPTIEVPDMVQFMCEYIQNDNIGTFASAHLAWADFLEDGIFSQKCISIAKKYPFVLDFAKTGKTEYLTREEKPHTYPDFMVKGSRNNNYRSSNALGLLYRFIRSLETCVPNIAIECSSIKFDEHMKYPDWEKHIEWAAKHRANYVSIVTRLINKYGIQTEAEAISGYIGESSKCYKGREELNNIMSVVKCYLINTMRKYRYLFLRDLEQERVREHLSEEQFLKRKYEKASAWYMVAYQNASSPILSFAWVISDVLVDVQQAYLTMNHILREPVESSLLSSVDEFLILGFHISDYAFEECPCLIITPAVISDWMSISRLSLTMMASKKSCPICVQRIVENFLNSSNINCCSFMDDNSCLCSYFCSPSKVIIDFLKFYLSNVTSLGKCEGACTGFRDFNLQTVALQTYIRLAATRNKKYLGMVSYEDSTEDQEGLLEEGDPLRISVSNNTQILHLLKNHLEEVKRELKKITLVADVQITVEMDHQESHYILISSTGTSWQRWNLEELVMDSSISDLLQSRIISPHNVGIRPPIYAGRVLS